jgi:DNA-binding response OmpR family regulator
MPDTILLVEDDETLRGLVAGHLSEAGFAVILAADGMAALQALDDNAPVDLLLTDLHLPGGPHGLSLANMTKARLGIPVLFITGDRELSQQRESLPGKLFSKPVDLAELTTEIRHQLAAAAAAPSPLDAAPAQIRRWRRKADELRSAADGNASAPAQRDLRHAARTYDALADSSEARNPRQRQGTTDREPESG